MPFDFHTLAGVLDVGSRATGAALRHDIAGATFALATLGRYTELKLNLFKAHACTGVTNNFSVGNSVTNADDHGLACWLNKIIQ